MLALRTTLLTCLLVTLTACSSFAPRTDAERVEARAQQRLDLLLKGDVEKAYTFMTPGYRTANSIDHFRANFAAGISRLVTAKVRSVTCPEEDVCTVISDITYNHVSALGGKPIPIERATQERWIKVDDQWWFVRLN